MKCRGKVVDNFLDRTYLYWSIWAVLPQFTVGCVRVQRTAIPAVTILRKGHAAAVYM